MSKISIIGTGSVGSTFAFSLMISGISREIVLIDRNKDKSKGECMDLNHGASFVSPVKIYPGDYSDCKKSDLIVITAGAKQEPGETRLDLVHKNTEIFKKVIPEVTKYAKDSILLIVTNPVDILTYVTLKISGFPKNKVLGSGTVLDSSRFRFLISQHCNIDARNIHAYIIGEHGDTELPVWSNAYVGGMLLSDYCWICKKKCNHKEELDKIFKKVKNSAYEIIDFKGATYYAIALALVRIAGAILRNENSVMPVSTLISDYYGIQDVCLSIPSVINSEGVIKFLKLKLSDIEQNQFKHSAETLYNIIEKLNL